MYNKIAVLRANALGDFIFTLPALQALRTSFPDAEIILLGRRLHQELLQDRPSPVDRVVVIPPFPGVGASEDIEPDQQVLDAFFLAMQREKFDVAFQLHGGGKNSNPFVKRLGASLTIGSRTPDAVALDINIPYTTYFNEVLRYLEIVSFIGARSAEIAPKLMVTPMDLEATDELISNAEHKPMALIQPGASDPRRWWPVEKFARVADHLASLGFLICINGTGEEQHLIDEIIRHMIHRESYVSFDKSISLSALVGLMAKASIVISNDTGPLHVAHALNTPAVGLYWAPNMITSMPIRCNTAKPLIAWNTTCPRCGLGFSEMKRTISSCEHNVSFVDEISVDRVIAAIHELLQANSKRSVELA